MLIKIEETQAKKLINFFLPSPVLPENSVVLAKGKSNHPLLKALSAFNGIERCLLADKFLSVKLSADALTDELKALILAEIDDYISENNSVRPEKNETEVLPLAEALADALIRPTLNRDNGDIVIHGFNNGVLEVQFTGHCAGCPYAQNTLQNVIAANLQRYVPQIKKISLKE